MSSIKSKTLLDNGLTRYLYEDGSYIDREAKVPYVQTDDDKKKEARLWRDSELKATDWTVPTTDHPKHAAYITYRKALRDWPSTADFPAKKPVLE